MRRFWRKSAFSLIKEHLWSKHDILSFFKPFKTAFNENLLAYKKKCKKQNTIWLITSKVMGC